MYLCIETSNIQSQLYIHFIQSLVWIKCNSLKVLPPMVKINYIHMAKLHMANTFTPTPLLFPAINLFQSAKDSQETPLNLKQGHWLRRKCVWCYATLYALKFVFQQSPAAVLAKSDATHLSCCWLNFNHQCKCYATVCILFTNSLHFHKSCNLHINNVFFFFYSRHSLWLH